MTGEVSLIFRALLVTALKHLQIHVMNFVNPADVLKF